MSQDEIKYVSVTRDAEHGYVLISYLVDLDNSNIMAGIAQAREATLALDPEQRCDRISDFTDVAIHVDYELVERASAKMESFHRKSHHNRRFAIVAPKDLEFGEARTFFGMMDVPQEVRVFRHLDEARQWIEETERQ